MESAAILFVKYVIMGVSLSAPVGPLNLEMIKRGLRGGFFPSWFVGLGGMTADLCFMLIIYFGLSQWLQLPSVEIGMYVVAVVVLFYLGFTSISSVFSDSFAAVNPTLQSGKNAYWTGFFIALANPINFVFWFGVYGTSLNSLLNKYTPAVSMIYSLSIFIGLLLWSLNIALTVHFSRSMLSVRVMKGITLMAGGMLLWFCAEFLQKLMAKLQELI